MLSYVETAFLDQKQNNMVSKEEQEKEKGFTKYTQMSKKKYTQNKQALFCSL